MKHTVPVTAILVAVFLASQLIGLGLIAAGTEVSVSETGERVVSHTDTALGPRPQTTGFQSFAYIVIGVAVGTLALLVLVRFRLVQVWKLWFFLAVWLASTISLGAILHKYVALALALVLAAWKIFRPNIIVHNITEVLVYTGIVLLIAPIFQLGYAALLLVVIAGYDAYAVWRSRHMVKMAQFQTESKLFAGLLVPYSAKSLTASMAPAKTQRPAAVKAAPAAPQGKSAILGGGDIAFPMLFAGAALDALIRGGLSRSAALLATLPIVVAATAALLLLFLFAKQDRFYPAMPFLAAGCFVGYGVTALLLL